MSNITSRYAHALLDLARETGGLSEYLAQAKIARAAFADDDFWNVVVHPHISVSEKHSLFRDAFGDKINDHVMGFFCLVAEKGRATILRHALDLFIEDAARSLGKITAYVVSAFELSADQTKVLEELLSRKMGKEVTISVSVDPDVIGGFYIHAEGYFIDRTIKNKLKEIKSVLIANE